MLELFIIIIIAAIFGTGFAAGFGVRERMSRTRRERRRRNWPGDAFAGKEPAAAKPQREPQPAEPAGDFAIDLDSLLTAANGDRAGRTPPPPERIKSERKMPERKDPPDGFDFAVRDLLTELNRRSAEESAPSHRGPALSGGRVTGV